MPQCQEALRGLAERNELPVLRFEQWLWFFIAATLLALNAWYWARQMLNIQFPSTPESTPRRERMRGYVPRICGIATLALVTIALWSAERSYSADEADAVAPRGIMRAAIITAALLTIVFFVFVQSRQRIFKVATKIKVRSARELPRRTWWALVGSAGFAFTLFLAFWLVPLQLAPLLGAPSIVLFAAATWIPFGSFCVYVGSRYEVPVLRLLLAVLLLFSFWNDNHRVRVMANVDNASAARLSIDDAAHAWLRARQAEIVAVNARHKKYPVLVVAAAGGGIRAAYWTASALSGLEDRYAGRFTHHVFGISGVSGGSLGSAAFVALLAERQAHRLPQCWNTECGTHLRPWASAVMSQDFLAPVIGSMLYTDLTQRFLPFPVPVFDRARTLEASWEKAWRDQGLQDDRLAQPFTALWANDRNQELPLLFLNSTVVESGRRAIVSSVAIDKSNFHDALDAAAVISAPIALSTAAHLSARFTYISPAAALVDEDNKLAMHLVDGGYFENAGLSTAQEIVTAFDKAAAQQLDQALCMKILVISNEQGYIANGESREGKPERFMSEAFAPIIALFNTRDARSRFVEAEVQVQRQAVLLGLEQRAGQASLPLGWMLSDVAQHEIDAQLRAALAEGGQAAVIERLLNGDTCD